MARRFDVFISHSHQDREWASQLADALKQRGLSVWFDDAQIKLGENWGRAVYEGLTRSSNIVFIVGPGAANSNNLAFELGMALGSGKRIIPVVAKDLPLAEIPGPIRLRRFLQANNPAKTAEEIAKTVAS